MTGAGVPILDEDAIVACADLVGRSGAKNFQIGYLHDDVPPQEAGWYAHAQYLGTRITAEDCPGPSEAADTLARRLLESAKCRCGKLVALSDAGAVAHNGTLLDGSQWTAAQAAAAGQCRWTRQGRVWVSACGAGTDLERTGPNRAQRRADERRDRRRR